MAVVGAGIVGLAHAWMAARRGLRVVVFERSPRAIGASIRNFGMIWPIGQPAGEPFLVALRSRAFWLELAEAAGLWLNPCGSIHLARHADELAVLDEFCSVSAAGDYSVRMLTRDEVLQRAPAANPDGLLGGMWSETELCVNSRDVIARLSCWLSEMFGVEFRFGSLVTSVEPGGVTTSAGQSVVCERTVICSGSDLQTLFPSVLAESGLKLCKLQMMKTGPQPDDWRIGPHLAGGLTLRHYLAFAGCPSHAALRQRFVVEKPELDRFGIHVMASQNNSGEVILGDSHEYDDEMTPFDSSEIESLMLRELRELIVLRDWQIVERWHGVYAKHPERLILEAEPQPGVHIAVGPGGAGMTLSFGLADRHWTRWLGE
ncbi:TIGR03364 family FAD-dependent oxidoreductase [bacterium]|nr:TIGR03364 family FAD-dependent oxidoreductase [bacterium]